MYLLVICIATFFYKKIYFLLFKMWIILKSLLNLLQRCFCVMLQFFGLKACGILVPRPGIKPTPPALEGEVSFIAIFSKMSIKSFAHF